MHKRKRKYKIKWKVKIMNKKQLNVEERLQKRLIIQKIRRFYLKN